MKRMLIVCCLLIVISVIAIDVYAVTDPLYDEQLVDDGLKIKAKSMWSTVIVIVQIVSVGCVVFAGVRYMFASADQKADIKQGLIYLTIGAVIIFGAITIIQAIVDTVDEII